MDLFQDKTEKWKTRGKSVWDNTEVVNNDIVEAVGKLKNQTGKDIIVYGGAGFVSSLIKEQQIELPNNQGRNA